MKRANDKYYRTKADGLFMKQFRGTHCEVCGSQDKTVGHHIVSKARSKALRYDMRNIIVLCPSHHKFSNDLAPHSSNQMACTRFVEWFKENKPAQYRWTKEHEHDQRKYNYKQACENLKNGRLAWD